MSGRHGIFGPSLSTTAAAAAAAAAAADINQSNRNETNQIKRKFAWHLHGICIHWRGLAWRGKPVALLPPLLSAAVCTRNTSFMITR